MRRARACTALHEVTSRSIASKRPAPPPPPLPALAVYAALLAVSVSVGLPPGAPPPGWPLPLLSAHFDTTLTAKRRPLSRWVATCTTP